MFTYYGKRRTSAYPQGIANRDQNIDEIIRIIKRSQSVDDARQTLMAKYKLDEIQANAILEMPLRRLASLERQKIEDEFKEVSKTIEDLKSLLASPKKNATGRY